MSTPVPTPNTNYQPKSLLTEEDGAALLSLLRNLNERVEMLEEDKVFLLQKLIRLEEQLISK